MNFRVGSKTDIGKARNRNDDALLVRDRLFAVADGMGGHPGGDVASTMTLEALADVELPAEGPLDVLVEHIKDANRAVLERGSAEGGLRGMGTTITAFLTEDERAHVAHVGDSRAYLFRDGAFQRLTEDHTLVQRMVREGRLSPEQAERHPQRNILTRALGVDEDLPVDKLTLDLHPGDRILLCTDGLTGMVDEERITEILQTEHDPQRACDRLVQEANRAGGEDNITVIVVDVTDGDSKRGAAGVATAPVLKGGTKEAGGRDGGGPSADQEASVAVPGDSVIWTGEEVGPGREDGETGGRRAAGRGIRWRRVTLWTAVAAILVAGGLIGVRIYVDHQWYVGESDGRVAIYNGIPANVLWFELSHVEVGTDIPAAAAARLQPYRDLEDGITASSLQDARNIVNQIRRDLARTSGGSGGG